MEQDGNRYRRFVKESQDDDYIKSYTQGKVYIGDFNLRCRPKDDASNSVASSDFIICSSKSKDRPLVLSNNMKNFGLTYYGTEKWNSANFPVLYGDRQTNKKNCHGPTSIMRMVGCVNMIFCQIVWSVCPIR